MGLNTYFPQVVDKVPQVRRKVPQVGSKVPQEDRKVPQASSKVPQADLKSPSTDILFQAKNKKTPAINTLKHSLLTLLRIQYAHPLCEFIIIADYMLIDGWRGAACSAVSLYRS